MKKFTLFSAILLFALNTFSQSKSLIETPLPNYNYVGNPIVLDSALYLRYQSDNNNYTLLKYDGDTLTVVPSPSGYEGPYKGYYDNPIVAGNDLYLRYLSDNNNYTLLKYDGDTLSVIPSPSGYEGQYIGYVGDPIAIGTDLYLRYQSNNYSYSLFKYDGDTLTEVPNPSGYENSYRGYQKNPIIYNNDLYLRYYSNDNYYSLFKYDGDTLTVVPNPSGYEADHKGYHGSPVIYNNDLYLRYQSNDHYYNLFKYDGDTLTVVVPNPSGYDAAYNGYYGEPIVYNNDLYLRYRANNYDYALFKYDGDTLNNISDAPGFEFDQVVATAGNNLFLEYDSYNSEHLFSFDGSTLTEITFTKYEYHDLVAVIDSNLFISYSDLETGTNTLFNYSGDNLIEIPNPSDYSTHGISSNNNGIKFNSDSYFRYRKNDNSSYNLFKYTDVDSVQSITVCDSLNWINGKTYTSSTNSDAIALEDINGNDSIVLLNLTVPQNSFNVLLHTYDSTYNFNDSILVTSGNYVDSLTSSVLCDSIVYLDLTLLQNPFQNTPNTICITDSLSFNLMGNEVLFVDSSESSSDVIATTLGVGSHNLIVRHYTPSGDYSIDTSGLFSYIDISASETFLNLYDDDQSEFLPLGFEFDYWGQTVDSCHITSNGWLIFDEVFYSSYSIGLPVYDEDYDNSIALIDVDLDPEEGGQISYATIGEAPNRIFVVDYDSVSYYNVNDVRFSAQLHIYETTNRIEMHTESADNVANGDEASQGIQSHDQYVALVSPGKNFNNQWIATNDYVAFVPNTSESTSVSHTIEIIAHSSTQTVSSCNSYEWIDGNTYTASNDSATFTLQNINGCDSVVTLDLTILNTNSETDTQTACDSYEWIDGNTYTESNNSATHTLTNVAGCDSVVTLNLTITNSNTVTDTQTACDSYEWIDGNTYTESNNSATHTLTNVAGCDSLVTLDLTINNSTIDTVSLTAIDSLVYGNFVFTENLDTTFIFTNENDCDSTIILTITIEESTDIQNISTQLMNIYPNPTSNVAILEGEDLGTYQLVNNKGKLIYKGQKTSYKEILELSELSNGLYFIILNKKSYPIIKQ